MPLTASARALLAFLVSVPLLAAPSPARAQQPARSAVPAAPASFRVMTFNIRYDNPADSANAWPHRAEGVGGLIRFHDPDLIGLQEAQRGQLDDLQRLLPGYAWFGQPRSDGGPGDEHSAILYRTDRFDLLGQGTFWLSETPDVPRSKGWDAALPRIATWGRFRDRATGDTILYLNTHFDHRGVRARAESARLLKRWLAANAGKLPVVVTGDLNTTPDSEPIAALLDAAAPLRLRDAIRISAEPPYGPGSTWNGFRAIVPDQRIDYVFVGDGLRVLEHGTLAETLDGVHYPSDHLPVLAEIVVQR
jgi:endonuclease/exonuclease/phosphatase family metal-dependent hydrolase